MGTMGSSMGTIELFLEIKFMFLIKASSRHVQPTADKPHCGPGQVVMWPHKIIKRYKKEKLLFIYINYSVYCICSPRQCLFIQCGPGKPEVRPSWLRNCLSTKWMLWYDFGAEIRVCSFCVTLFFFILDVHMCMCWTSAGIQAILGAWLSPNAPKEFH